MRVVLCALAKNEHKYINDWVKWYVGLGFDKIYIYDNDDVDRDYIGDYIEDKSKVEIINIRGVHKDKLQHDIYTKFYNDNRFKFDWCFFCDIDEFLVGVGEIHSFLSKPVFRNIPQIRVKWRLFGDNGYITRDMTKPVYKVFTREVINTLNRNLVDKGNLEKQAKMFVRGGLNGVVIRSPHFASLYNRDNVLPSCLPSGRMCFSRVAINENYLGETVFLNHYMTKSLSEFVEQKLNRSDAVFGDISIKLDYYWRINKKTQEKLDWLKERGLL